MIELNQVSKTFFKGKRNEVRAIRQTSMSFPSKGLVMLCGPSGSGKTTLLNVLGGLEYIDSGAIQFGDTKVSKRSTREWDTIRNERIGYIFQQYNLLKYLSVYENIELVLKMIGLKDKEEMERRIHYVLDMVGMLHYRHRKVSALSGGQQQRVGIARAIVKNPEVIIADEPTGNLDSKNTIEIMNIIKKISEQKLVILVTHERELAQFYADRIIEISDGAVVSDASNEHQNALDIRHQNTFYLKDMEQQTLAETPIPITWYKESTESPEQPIKITLITQHDSIYIQVDAGEKVKVRYVDEESGISIFDEHFKGLDQDEVKQNQFDLSQLASLQPIKGAKGSAISSKDAFVSAYRKLRGYSKMQKVMFLSFVFASMFIAIAIALIGKLYQVEPNEFQLVDRGYLVTDAIQKDLLEPAAKVRAINPLEEQQLFSLKLHTYYQINKDLRMTAHPSAIHLLKKENIMIGEYPSQAREAVLDIQVAKQLLTNSSYKQAGVTEISDFIGLELQSPLLGYALPIKITGISDTDSPTIWIQESLIYELALNMEIQQALEEYSNKNEEMDDAQLTPPISALESIGDKVKLVEGRLPVAAGEVMYPEAYKEFQGYALGKKINDERVKQSYTIVGFYNMNDAGQLMVPQEVLLTSQDLLKEQWNGMRSDKQPVLIYTDDPEQTKQYLADRGNLVISAYDKSLKQHKADVRSTSKTLLSVAFTLLAISLLQLYFIIRASLLNRIYDIGVYRSLGASKWDIHKMFIIEIALLTTATSLIGYLLMVFLIKEIERMLVGVIKLFYFPVPYIVGGIVLIYLINIISGLIPVYRITRKSPSQILKQYDA